MLQALAKRFEGLEPLAKARTMLAGTFMRPEALAACRDELRSLAEQVWTHCRHASPQWQWHLLACELHSGLCQGFTSQRNTPGIGYLHALPEITLARDTLGHACCARCD